MNLKTIRLPIVAPKLARSAAGKRYTSLDKIRKKAVAKGTVKP
jgi:hypothetical protein